jgi:5'(3')-deoxyribonucleotidase
MKTILKIETILRSDLANWKTMSRDQLLDIMLEDRRFFLETEVQQGNAEYLDELLEEIDVPAVWATTP